MDKRTSQLRKVSDAVADLGIKTEEASAAVHIMNKAMQPMVKTKSTRNLSSRVWRLKRNRRKMSKLNRRRNR